MKTKTSVRILCCVLLVLLASSAASAEDWVQDWFGVQSHVMTAPATFNGARRNYLSGGGFRARWENNRDFMFGVTKPSISAGCGGIDLLNGSFGFLDGDYLLQKLQNMAKMAPAIAFQIALKVLNEALDDSLTFFTGVLDMLNGLQMDECAMTKALVTIPFDGGKGAKEAFGIDKISQMDLWNNDSGLYTEIKKEWTSADNWTEAFDKVADQLSGCAPEFRNSFLNDSVLGAVNENTTTLGYKETYVDLIRAIVGDVTVIDTATSGQPTLEARFVDPCPANSASDFLDAAMKGELRRCGFQRGSGQQGCTCPQKDASSKEEDGTLETVGARLESIKTKISRLDDDFTDEELDIMYRSPIDIYTLFLVMRPMEGEMETALVEYKEALAKVYAYWVMRDLFVRALQVVQHAKQVWDTQAGKSQSNNPHECQVDPIAEIPKHLNTLDERIRQTHAKIWEEYRAVWAKLNTESALSEKIAREKRAMERGVANTAAGSTKRP